MRKVCLFFGLMLAIVQPVLSQDIKATVLKHLQTSRDFTIKVAEAMPAENYDFKLTPPQMSFGQQ